MRYLILSDLHANLQATSRVLEHAASRGYDRAVVLGDLVGYGADPAAVLDRIQDLDPLALVRGNHDKVVGGITDGECFNDVALDAAMWTRSILGREHIEYLRSLPEGPAQVDGFLISHGTPVDEEDYLLGQDDADEVFVGTDFELAFFGHTHFPCAFEQSAGRPGKMARTGESTVRLAPGARYLVNPGSVGQPRDRDPRASYVTFDTRSREIAWHRIEYDCEEARARIVTAGLPPVLGERLIHGV